MAGGHLLHLYLHLTVGRIHVVKLLFAGSTCIALHLGIEQLIQVQYLTLTTQVETQVVESAILIFRRGLMSPLAQHVATYQPQ